MGIKDEENKVLDKIIETRRTVRAFTKEIPTKAMIEAIVHAGLWAPYAKMAITRVKDFRRFFIIRNGNPILNRISDLIRQQATVTLEHLEKTFNKDPSFREKGENYFNIVKGLTVKGYPDLPNYPCLIIIAEQRGIPQAENQSLAHVVQNMWLKASALGLGLRLMSVIEILTENKEFSELLGLNFGEYAFTGCILGFASIEPEAAERPFEEDVIAWL
jgi:nitroreductase